MANEDVTSVTIWNTLQRAAFVPFKFANAKLYFILAVKKHLHFTFWGFVKRVFLMETGQSLETILTPYSEPRLSCLLLKAFN